MFDHNWWCPISKPLLGLRKASFQSSFPCHILAPCSLSKNCIGIFSSKSDSPGSSLDGRDHLSVVRWWISDGSFTSLSNSLTLSCHWDSRHVSPARFNSYMSDEWSATTINPTTFIYGLHSGADERMAYHSFVVVVNDSLVWLREQYEYPIGFKGSYACSCVNTTPSCTSHASAATVTFLFPLAVRPASKRWSAYALAYLWLVFLHQSSLQRPLALTYLIIYAVTLLYEQRLVQSAQTHFEGLKLIKVPTSRWNT